MQWLGTDIIQQTRILKIFFIRLRLSCGVCGFQADPCEAVLCSINVLYLVTGRSRHEGTGRPPSDLPLMAGVR